jgi:hypothetical protein
MDAQDIRNLQEAYLEVYTELDEAKVDNSMDNLKKLDVRDKRHLDTLDASKKSRLDWAIYQGKTSVSSDRKRAHTQRRGRKKPIARTVGGSGHFGKHYQSQQEKKASKMSPEEIKKQKRESMRKRMAAAAERRGFDEQVDIYDIILLHLLDEGYAETPEAAEAIMVNMSEEWRNSIIG